MVWLLAVLSLVALLSSARAQCAVPLMTTSYVVDRGAEVFQGNNTFDTSCAPSVGLFNCLGSGSGNVSSVLVDGQTGGSALDLSAVNAWSRDFYVAFVVVESVNVIQADLYFYNIPSQRIGLPDIELFWSGVQQFEPMSPLRHTVLDNQDLSQDDNELTRVTLRVATSFLDIPSFPFFRIQFRFSAESSIDWLLLSEVQLCEVQDPVPNNAITLTEGNEVLTFGPTEITSSHSLSCTVANEGLFQWQWTTPNNVPFEMRVANSRRTSIIQLTGITAMSGGYVGDFVCRAEYDVDALPISTPPGAAMSRTITFDLRAILEPDEDVVQLTAGNTFAVLVCEVYGYLIAAPDIEWHFRNAIVFSNDVYTITTRDGNNTIEVGGDIRPSLRSVLNISLAASSGIIGDYICLSNAVSDGVKIVTLQQASSTATECPPSALFPGATPDPADTCPPEYTGGVRLGEDGRACYNGLTGGSTAVFLCDTAGADCIGSCQAVCVSTGQWSATFESVECMNREGLSTGAIAGVAVGVVVVILLVASFVTFALCLVYFRTRYVADRSDPGPEYDYVGPAEKFQVEANAAYGPVKRDPGPAYEVVRPAEAFEMEGNAAYGPARR